jgi:peptidoglycan/LPS O-acetylase OafA/YrhL
MDVWLMTDPIFWVTFGVWFGFLIGLCTGALVALWRPHPRPSSVSPE